MDLINLSMVADLFHGRGRKSQRDVLQALRYGGLRSFVYLPGSDVPHPVPARFWIEFDVDLFRVRTPRHHQLPIPIDFAADARIQEIRTVLNAVADRSDEGLGAFVGDPLLKGAPKTQKLIPDWRDLHQRCIDELLAVAAWRGNKVEPLVDRHDTEGYLEKITPSPKGKGGRKPLPSARSAAILVGIFVSKSNSTEMDKNIIEDVKSYCKNDGQISPESETIRKMIVEARKMFESMR